MKKEIKLTLRDAIYIIILGILIYLLTKQYLRSSYLEREFQYTRREKVLKDSLTKLGEGKYKKILNDYNTKKSLSDTLKKNNEELLKEITKSENKLISVTRALLKLKSKNNSLKIPKGETLNSFIIPGKKLDFYYPDEEKPLVIHKVTFGKDNINSRWEFKPISLDLVISETKHGIFEANLNSNKWVDIKSLQVNTLPLKDLPELNKFSKWGFGVGVEKHFYKPVNEKSSIGIKLLSEYKIINGRLNVLGSIGISGNPSMGIGFIYRSKLKNRSRK